MRTITLDTCIVRDMLEGNQEGHMRAIVIRDLVVNGELDAAVTERIRVDVPVEPLRSALKDLPEPDRKTIGSLFRSDVSDLGSRDVLASRENADMAKKLLRLMFPRANPKTKKHPSRLADIDHLLGHYISGRDVFLTSDRAILARAGELSKFGVIVRSVEQFLKEEGVGG